MKNIGNLNEASTCVSSNIDTSDTNGERSAYSYDSVPAGNDDDYYISAETSIVSAATNKDHDALLSILKPMLDKNDVSHLDSICALHWACYCGHPELVETLLNVGCDPHCPDDINLETPIYFGIRGSNVQIVQMLVKRFGTELLCHENRKRLTPFLLAASEFLEDNVISTLHMLEFLYLSGVSLEEQDASGRTALMLASRRGCQFVVQWLLSRGANLAHRDHMGNTVLHHACESGNDETLMFLCMHGGIGLVHSKALAATANEETALGICLMKRRFLQYSMLKIWSWQYALTGRMLVFRSPHPLYFWAGGIINLVLYWRIYSTLETATSMQAALVDVWILGWIASYGFWIITSSSDPGKARKNPVMSQSHRTSSNFENDIMKDAPMLGGTYEAQLQSLQKQQELINYELYRINCEAYRLNSWVPHEDFSGELSEPLDPHGYAGEDGMAQRMQVCREEAQILQTEMHALYPQVGVERQEHCVFGYADAVMGSVRDLSISTVCITCNMIRAARSHHCATCGVCMVRQDHHCAWLDNCVAKGNQRAFAVFVSSVCIGLCHTYYLVYLHFAAEYARMKFDWAWDVPIILFGVLVNAACLAFAVRLCLRISRNMATDVTFYEYLRKPEHIRQRFKGQVEGKFWDFADMSLLKAIANCGSFWVAS